MISVCSNPWLMLKTCCAKWMFTKVEELKSKLDYNGLKMGIEVPNFYFNILIKSIKLNTFLISKMLMVICELANMISCTSFMSTLRTFLLMTLKMTSSYLSLKIPWLVAYLRK